MRKGFSDENHAFSSSNPVVNTDKNYFILIFRRNLSGPKQRNITNKNKSINKVAV